MEAGIQPTPAIWDLTFSWTVTLAVAMSSINNKIERSKHADRHKQTNTSTNNKIERSKHADRHKQTNTSTNNKIDREVNMLTDTSRPAYLQIIKETERSKHADRHKQTSTSTNNKRDREK